ncbi:MAG: carboxypeptidase regulatory-like domain-containing protein [Thermoplasmata archaeon]|nr:carboxypeptidase regulatory-like domain-containing protein [Thermoplasmata archaeon]
MGFFALLVVVALLTLPLAVGQSRGGTRSPDRVVSDQGRPARDVPAGDVTPPSGWPTPIRHVFIVMLENAEATTVEAKGPFEESLAANYASASQYYAVCHPSAPNYLALTSGTSWQCGSDSYHTYSSENLGDLAQKAGLGWDGFEESMPSRCDLNDSYPYAVKHNPLVYYSDIVGNTTECRAHDLPFTNWTADVSANTIPAFAMFTPNLTDDGHDTGVAFADKWLAGWLSPLLNDSFFSQSVFFLTYDEGVNDDSGYNGTAGGRVYFTAVSPYARAGFNLTTNASHYSLLSTVEWLLGLGNCGHNDSTGAFPPLKSLFDFPPNYTVSGTVASATTGAPIAGAQVSLTGEPETTTSAGGAFSFTVPNGTYQLGVLAPQYVGRSIVVNVSGQNVEENVNLTPASSSLSLSGTVSALGSRSPLTGARVVVSGGRLAITGPGGVYALALESGRYSVTVSDSGERSVTQAVAIVDVPVVLDFSLVPLGPPAFPLTGAVLGGPSARPLAGAPVVLDGSTIAWTGAGGTYLFLCRNGSYTLTASFPGYGAATATVVVAGEPQVSNLTLPLAQLSRITLQVTASARVVAVGSPETLTVNASGGSPPYHANWSFGDGDSADGLEVTHSFAASGVYLLSVVVTDASNDQTVGYLNVTAVVPNGTPPPPVTAEPSAQGGVAPVWWVAGAVAAVGLGAAAIVVRRARRQR